MAVQFLSKEWGDALHEKLKEEFSKHSNLSTTFCQIIKGCPDGKDKWILYGLQEGVLSNFEIGEGEPPEAAYRVLGPYSIYTDFIEGRMDAKKALITKKLQLEGSMTRALGLLGAYTRIEKNQRTIETTF